MSNYMTLAERITDFVLAELAERRSAGLSREGDRGSVLKVVDEELRRACKSTVLQYHQVNEGLKKFKAETYWPHKDILKALEDQRHTDLLLVRMLERVTGLDLL